MSEIQPTPLDHEDPEVAAAIHRVMMEAYRVESELLRVADFVPLRRTRDQIAGADSVFFGCHADGGVVAVAEVETPSTQPANIASLVVLPDYFRRGLGTTLVEHVCDRHAGNSVTVSTGIQNAPALALYARLGFRERQFWTTNDGIEMVTLIRA